MALTPAAGTVAATDGRLSLGAAALASFPDAHFSGGRLVFTGGGNTGFVTEVKRHAADGQGTLQLWQAPPAPIVTGCETNNHMAMAGLRRDYPGLCGIRRKVT